MTRSEALRLTLDRTAYLQSQMGAVEELANKYHPVLTPALQEFGCENFRTVARALPAIVWGYIQEAEKYGYGWKDDFGKEVNIGELKNKLEELHPSERIYLLDCIVDRRGWSSDPEFQNERRSPHVTAPEDSAE